MGGGGSAGKVGYPTYLEEQHGQFLVGASGSGNSITPTTSIYDLWEDGLGVGGNPYTGLSYSDPASDFTELEGLSTAFKDEVDGIVPADELTDAVNSAVKAADSNAITLATKAFQDSQKQTRARSLRSFSSEMAGINAVNSSAYMFGIALIESAALQSVENFRADLTIRQQEQLTQNFIDLRLQKAQLLQTVASITAEVKRLKVVAEAEYVANEADLSYKHANWEWEVVLNTVTAMGGLGGGTRLPGSPSKTASALGGALSGAATGAAIGSVVPGLGTAVGAGIGGLLGLASGVA